MNKQTQDFHNKSGVGGREILTELGHDETVAPDTGIRIRFF